MRAPGDGGLLYVATPGSGAIRTVDPVTGAVATLTTAPPLVAPAAIAFNAAGTIAYVTEGAPANAVVAVNVSSGAVVVLAQCCFARMSGPRVNKHCVAMNCLPVGSCQNFRAVWIRCLLHVSGSAKIVAEFLARTWALCVKRLPMPDKKCQITCA